MSKLVLIPWKEQPTITNKYDPDYPVQARYGEKVFLYDTDLSRAVTDETNKAMILKAFGQASVYRKNLMSIDQMEATDLKENKRPDGKKSLNRRRIEEINTINDMFAHQFLSMLHYLSWNDLDVAKKRAIQSTIDPQEALELLKVAMTAVYDLLLASVDDKFNKDLALTEMRKVIDIHNLNNEYVIGQKK